MATLAQDAVGELKLDLPNPNTLLPKKFDLIPETEHSNPAKIEQYPEGCLWYKKDNKFKLPKAYIAV